MVVADSDKLFSGKGSIVMATTDSTGHAFVYHLPNDTYYVNCGVAV
jgi:hypothetical protein